MMMMRGLLRLSSKTNKRSVGGIGSCRMNSSKVIVQKYGGTSVGGVDKLEKVFDIVNKFRNDSTRTFLHLTNISPIHPYYLINMYHSNKLIIQR